MKTNWIRLERAFPSWLNRKTDETITILKMKGTKVKYIIYTNHGNKFAFTRNQAIKLAKEYMEVYK